MKYLFKNKLQEGLIKSRPNRFIMIVSIEGKEEKCHCPSTGKIGTIKFEEIPCLLSRAENPERKTRYTVEAFSLDKIDKKNKRWIGINQGKANEYVGFFIKNNLLGKMTGRVREIKREVSLGKSRIDFKINDKDYIEIKTPLRDIPTSGHEKHMEDKGELESFDRLIKHFRDISNSIGSGSRAILLMCRIYYAEAFKVPGETKKNSRIVKAARKARDAGMENWQINLKIDKTGVELLDYFELNLF